MTTKDPTSSKEHEGKFFPSADIICDEVSKQFNDETSPAVDQVSFTVDSGDLVVLLGPSGCGKTTILKMINRLYEPTSGRILIGGADVRDLSATDLRRHIGYVIQQIGLFPHMNNADNISTVPRLLNWDQKKIDHRIDELLELTGLPQLFRTRYPRQLSGGEQQRIGLARALAADPPILLMDEPFAAIDAITRESLQMSLLEIQQKVHKTVIFVTHDVEEAFKLADKIVVLRAGKLVQYGTPLEIVTQPQNEFVEELVGTHNTLRRLSLLNVQSILDTKPAPKILEKREEKRRVTVDPYQDLRSALSLLLKTNLDEMHVVNEEGEELGTVTFDDLRAALVNHTGQNGDLD